MGRSDFALYFDVDKIDQSWAENLGDGMQTSNSCLADLFAYHCLVTVRGSPDFSPLSQDELPEG